MRKFGFSPCVHLLGHFRQLASFNGADFAVGKKSVQVTNRQSFVQIAPVTGVLTGVGADTAARGREGVARAIQFQGLIEFALGQKCDETLHIYAGRTGISARSGKALIDNKRVGICLRVRAKNRFSFTQSGIKFVGNSYRTYFGTFAAAGALVKVNISGVFLNLYFEIAERNANLLQFGPRNCFDIQLAPTLDNLW